MAHSKKTIALLSQHPTFSDWIVNNLSASQLASISNSPDSTVSFGEGHPLSCEALGVQLWKAYTSSIIYELAFRHGDLENYGTPVFNGFAPAYYHQAVCDAIKYFAYEEPDLLKQIVAKQRAEIEASTGPAQTLGSTAGAGRKRL